VIIKLVWKSCGYISLTKDGKKLKVVIKKQVYIAKLDDVKAVLDGKLDYIEILEPSETKK
jgi:hypothetical protein